MKCPKCGGEMEEGIMKPFFGGKQVWIKKGKLTIFGAPEIKMYSCIKCGFIESYTERTNI